MLKSDRVDVIRHWLAWYLMVLGTKSQETRLKVGDRHAPAVQSAGAFRPCERVGLRESRIGLRSKEQTRVKLIGLDWVCGIGLLGFLRSL